MRDCAKTETGQVKPVLWLMTDRGPDECPTHPKVLQQHIKLFKELDLDTLIVTCYPPGCSSWNPVERRMFPINLTFSGVIFIHDHYGVALKNGECIDDKLERQNFWYAQECCAARIRTAKFGGFPYYCDAVPAPAELNNSVVSLDHKWDANHVRQGKLFSQL